MDSSGHGYHLTLGPDAAIAPGGKHGRALDADATTEDGPGAYRYRTEPALNPGDRDWTLECWVKAKPSMRADNRVWGLSGVHYIDYGRGDHLAALQVANQFLPVGGWNWPTGNLKVDAAYHHLAVVYDSRAKQLRHYFDGRLRHKAPCRWKAVEDGRPGSEAVFPPHYPMLQVGMRDALQQWDERELSPSQPRHMKKFEGFIDEMRFSDTARYRVDFTPPRSFARPFLRVWPQALSVVAVAGEGDPAPQAVSVSSGTMPIAWAVAEKVSWLSGRRASGGASVSVAVTVGRLKPGRYTGALTFTAPGAVNHPVQVPIQLRVIRRASIRDVSDRKQLFIDRRFIERGENFRLTVNPAEKVPLVFEPAADGPLYPNNVIHDEKSGRYRMYYGAFARSRLHYAESTDGLHWTRPTEENVVTYAPGPGQPLVPLGMGAAVMLDPKDVPERRFKAFQDRIFRDGPEANGVYAYYSADGLHFTEAGRVLPILAEGGPIAAWDGRIGRYVAYMRVMNTKQGLRMLQGNQFFYRPSGPAEAVGPETLYQRGYENVRSVGRIEIDDLLKPWPYRVEAPRTIYTSAAAVPMVLSAEPQDGFVDFYNNSATIYPYAQDVYLMFPAAFRHFHPSRQPWFYKFADANGPIEVQLAVSRDGIRWSREDRSPYVPMGLSDESDRWLTMLGVGMVRRGSYLYQYYWTTGRLHDSLYLRPEYEQVAVAKAHGLGAVRQRLDGFISADVDHRGGSITTAPITFSGSRLQLNHNSGATGTIFVELRDLNDQPIPGYTLADCEEITGNDVGWEVRWQGSPDLSALAGRPVKLHFRLRATRLYAFQFVSGR